MNLQKVLQVLFSFTRKMKEVRYEKKTPWSATVASFKKLTSSKKVRNSFFKFYEAHPTYTFHFRRLLVNKCPWKTVFTSKFLQLLKLIKMD